MFGYINVNSQELSEENRRLAREDVRRFAQSLREAGA